jgi:Ca-activated chloride channel family protein
MRTRFIATALVAVCALSYNPPPASARQGEPAATFKSGVDLVRLAAVVRDRKGRFVKDLTARDFVILDNGESQRITDFRHDLAGVSVALLFDVSGSMASRLVDAREAATHLLSWLEADRDEAAIFTFDTRLDEIMSFGPGLHALPDTLASIRPFGATSLHDAIAQAAERVATREGLRRAVVVFTDGNDTASAQTPEEVSAIASAIDVPVYIVGVVPLIDNPAGDLSLVSGRPALEGSLSDLASWTGGHTFVVSTPAQRSLAARTIVDELRQQYLFAFESSARSGWHPLVIQARDKSLTIRARSGYVAGQSRPTSN